MQRGRFFVGYNCLQGGIELLLRQKTLDRKRPKETLPYLSVGRKRFGASILRSHRGPSRLNQLALAVIRYTECCLTWYFLLCKRTKWPYWEVNKTALPCWQVRINATKKMIHLSIWNGVVKLKILFWSQIFLHLVMQMSQSCKIRISHQNYLSKSLTLPKYTLYWK